MTRLLDRIDEALAMLDRDENQNWEPASGSDPTIDSTAGPPAQRGVRLGQTYDSVRFGLQGASDALERINIMMEDAHKFVEMLGQLAQMPIEKQQAFEQYDGGYVFRIIQDIAEDVEALDLHTTDARNALTQVVKAADRYAAEFRSALHPIE